MKLTTKGRYAVTAMLDLAFHSEDGPTTLAGVSGRQGISLSYLEQLFTRLRKRGLVSSTRGPGGGYSLGKDAATIAIADIIDAVDENIDSRRCGGLANCQDDKLCLTHDLWTGLSEQINDFLQGISLADLTNKESVREVMARQGEKSAADVNLTLPERQGNAQA
ncbi:MAG: Rrf2 family transcriptional regulator [Gammaproteobacteria bacterium]|nr:Rrf2 family transcriptional regulator [Gammaproteobacteria bacterium]